MRVGVEQRSLSPGAGAGGYQREECVALGHSPACRYSAGLVVAFSLAHPERSPRCQRHHRARRRGRGHLKIPLSPRERECVRAEYSLMMVPSNPVSTLCGHRILLPGSELYLFVVWSRLGGGGRWRQGGVAQLAHRDRGVVLQVRHRRLLAALVAKYLPTHPAVVLKSREHKEANVSESTQETIASLGRAVLVGGGTLRTTREKVASQRPQFVCSESRAWRPTHTCKRVCVCVW